MDDATQAPRRRSRWRRRVGIGCLGLLVIGALAAAAMEQMRHDRPAPAPGTRTGSRRA